MDSTKRVTIGSVDDALFEILSQNSKELFRILVRQRSTIKRVRNAEDNDVRADTQSQSQYGNDGETSSFA